MDGMEGPDRFPGLKGQGMRSSKSPDTVGDGLGLRMGSCSSREGERRSEGQEEADMAGEV